MAAPIPKNTYTYKEFRLRLIPAEDSSPVAEFINIPYSPKCTENTTTDLTLASATTVMMNSTIRTQDSLIAEEISTTGVLWTLKFLYIAPSPPSTIIQLDAYRKVSKLEISCGIDINWLFCHVLHKLPRLEFLKLWTQVFDNQQQQMFVPEGTLFGIQCPSIRHLHLRTTPTPKAADNTQLIQSVNLVFHYLCSYLKKLSQVDFRLPIGTKLDEFLVNFPRLQNSGNLNVNYKHQVSIFSTYPTNQQRDSKTQNPPPRRHSSVQRSSSIKAEQQTSNPSLETHCHRSASTTNRLTSGPALASLAPLVLISSSSDSDPDTTTAEVAASSKTPASRIRKFSGEASESPRCTATPQSPIPSPPPPPSIVTTGNPTQKSSTPAAALSAAHPQVRRKKVKLDYTNLEALYERRQPKPS